MSDAVVAYTLMLEIDARIRTGTHMCAYVFYIGFYLYFAHSLCSYLWILLFLSVLFGSFVLNAIVLEMRIPQIYC